MSDPFESIPGFGLLRTLLLELQTRLGLAEDAIGEISGGSAVGAYEETAPRAVLEADNGKWLAPTGAGTFALPVLSSLPDGFEVSVYLPTGIAGTVIVDPDVADHFDEIGVGSHTAGLYLSSSTERGLLRLRKGGENTWVAIDEGSTWSVEVVATALQVGNLDALLGLQTTGFPPGTYSTVMKDVDPTSGAEGLNTLGTVTQTNAYTDASSIPQATVVLKLTNLTGSPMSINSTCRYIVTVPGPASWNVAVLSSVTWSFQGPFTVAGSETVTFYLNNGPNNGAARLYLRSSNSVPQRSFAAAVTAGAV